MTPWRRLPANIHVIRHGVDVIIPIRFDIHIVIQHINGPVAEHAVVPARLVVPVAEGVADEAGPLVRAQALALGQGGHIKSMLHGCLVQPEALAGLGRALCKGFGNENEFITRL